MFHPLAEDPSKLKEKDLDEKVLDLTKKYHIALRLGHGGIANQIAIALEMYKIELHKRQQTAMQSTMKKQNKDLDDLINVN